MKMFFLPRRSGWPVVVWALLLALAVAKAQETATATATTTFTKTTSTVETTAQGDTLLPNERSSTAPITSNNNNTDLNNNNNNNNNDEAASQMIELGLENFAATIRSQDWTCVLLYDPHNQVGTQEQTHILEGLVQRLTSRSTTSNTTKIGFGRLNLRQHAALRDEYYSVEMLPPASADELPHIKDDEDESYDLDLFSPAYYDSTTLLNFELGQVHWPAKVLIVGRDFNVYARLELATLLMGDTIPSTRRKIHLLDKWFSQNLPAQTTSAMDEVKHKKTTTYRGLGKTVVGNNDAEEEERVETKPVVVTRTNFEKLNLAYNQYFIDNSFTFKRYEAEQYDRMQQDDDDEDEDDEKKPYYNNGYVDDHDEDREESLQQKMKRMRYLLETDSKDDGRKSNDFFFTYKKARVKKVKSSQVYLGTLGTVIEEYLGWCEGYESTWSEERKAREDEQTNFGKHLTTMNTKIQQLIDEILDDEHQARQDPRMQEELKSNPKLKLRMQVPPLKAYYQEMVFGAGRSPRRFRQAMNELQSTMGASAHERFANRHHFNGTEFPLVLRLREYLLVEEKVEEEPILYSMIMAEFVTAFYNILREFHLNLNRSYVKYLKDSENARPHGNQFQFRTMDILDMTDPADHDLLTNYHEFHKRYTVRGTPVILANVVMTTQETLTLASIVRQCAASDVTASVHVSKKVGQRQAGNGWGGLQEYVLEDSLLNRQRIFGKDAVPRSDQGNEVDPEGDHYFNDGEVDDSDEEGEEEAELGGEEEKGASVAHSEWEMDEPDPMAEPDRSLTMEQFAILSKRIDTLYLHDYSLPGNCDRILYEDSLYDENQKFQIPSVIASYDLFQRLPKIGYAHSWPSLFIGKKGSNSKLHIDSGATGFFMYLISGRKRWMVYNRDERVHLYERIDDYSVYPDVLGMGKDELSDEFLSRRFPLLHRAEGGYEIIQEPGQLVYIPPSCPHAVENLDDIIGIAMNIAPLDGVANHLVEQIHSSSEMGVLEMAMDYLLFQENAYEPAVTKDPLYTSFGEYKAQY